MYLIRLIEPDDKAAVAAIIRTVMPEFDCVGEGYSIEDPEVDDMYTAFQGKGRQFFVIERETDRRVLGCAGYAPLAGGQYPDTCELQKMYFLNELRGQGLGKKVLLHCIEAARTEGYTKMYLETVNRMVDAGRLYTKMGFAIIPDQLGATGHSGCDTFMMREI